MPQQPSRDTSPSEPIDSAEAESRKTKAGPVELDDEELSSVTGGLSFWFPGSNGSPIRSSDETEGLGIKIE